MTSRDVMELSDTNWRLLRAMPKYMVKVSATYDEVLNVIFIHFEI